MAEGVCSKYTAAKTKIFICVQPLATSVTLKYKNVEITVTAVLVLLGPDQTRPGVTQGTTYPQHLSTTCSGGTSLLDQSLKGVEPGKT